MSIDNTAKKPSFRDNPLPWLLLAAGVVLLTVYVRWRLIDVPFERDEGEYAYMGQLLLQGVPPYLQAYTMKLPGVSAAYALAMLLFGQTIFGVLGTALKFRLAKLGLCRPAIFRRRLTDAGGQR